MWSLQLVATVRSKQAVRHVAWSPYNPCQAAFICHDGSLHIFTLSQPPLAPADISVKVQVSGCLAFIFIASFALHVLLQCNDVVHDQASMDSDAVSSGEYVIMYTPDTAVHQSFCSAHGMSIAIML